MSDILVDINNMTFKRDERIIYDDISLQIPKGKVTAIMGPSGIGKTTLLRLIGGQLKPESGHIYFDGKDIPSLSRSELYSARKRMSMLFQSGALFTDMSVYENVAFPIREHSQLSEAIIEKMVLMNIPISALAFSLLGGFYWKKVNSMASLMSILFGLASILMTIIYRYLIVKLSRLWGSLVELPTWKYFVSLMVKSYSVK